MRKGPEFEVTLKRIGGGCIAGYVECFTSSACRSGADGGCCTLSSHWCSALRVEMGAFQAASGEDDESELEKVHKLRFSFSLLAGHEA